MRTGSIFLCLLVIKFESLFLKSESTETPLDSFNIRYLKNHSKGMNDININYIRVWLHRRLTHIIRTYPLIFKIEFLLDHRFIHGKKYSTFIWMCVQIILNHCKTHATDYAQWVISHPYDSIYWLRQLLLDHRTKFKWTQVCTAWGGFI